MWHYIKIAFAAIAFFVVLFTASGWLLYLFGYTPGEEVANALDRLAATILGAIGLLVLAAAHTIIRMLEYNNQETKRVREIVENGNGIHTLPPREAEINEEKTP